MFRIALGLAILLAAFALLGQKFVLLFATADEIQAKLGYLGAVAFGIFVKYFLVATVIYIILRLIKLDHFVDLNGRGSTRLLVANSITISYFIILYLARMVEGGGFGFLVGQFAPLVLWPSWATIVWGLALLWRTRKAMPPSNNDIERARER